MYRSDELLFVSPTDLTKYLACRHLTRLDLLVARGELAKPADSTDEMLETLFTRGLDHEKSYLQTLRERGLSIVEIESTDSDARSLRGAERATESAMADGVDVIYQATFFDGKWRGHADFLIRRERPGRWAWSYDVADTKLARRMKVPALLQMATYADRLTTLQAVAPRQLVVVTGDGAERVYAFDDCAAYARRIRAQLLEFLAGDSATVPRPVRQCGQCRWQPRCSEEWRAADDLSLVAFMGGLHAERLRAVGISTVRALGQRSADQLPPSIGLTARRRLVGQARLQLDERDSGRPTYELLPPEPGRGLCLLPQPSSGDVFFDIEGDPFVGEHGLEYLWGLVHRGAFSAYWATDVGQEKQAFEQLVDHLITAWDDDPGMHIYHYAPYEPTRLKALSGRYDTRGAEIDRLLRGQRLVDLYAVVRQGLRISKESYSIKKLEAYYWGHGRGHDGVSDAMGSVVAFERWLATGEQRLLDNIGRYNEDDCRSTEALRDWLEKLRVEGGGEQSYRRPEHGDGRSSDAADAAATELEVLSSALLAGIESGHDEPAAAQRLLAGLLDWHRRESLPEWWEFFTRLQSSDEELVLDSAAVGELSDPHAVGTDKRSTIWRLSFPPQDAKLSIESKPLNPRTGQAVGEITVFDPELGFLELKRSTSRGEPDCTSLVPAKPIADAQQRARLKELGEWVLANGIDSPRLQWRAARDLLMRRPPSEHRGPLRQPEETAEDALCRLAAGLNHRVLPVQGPPGTGKTWAGARTILQLVRQGRKVGVTAFSHKVISNLLTAIAAAAAEADQQLTILQRADEHNRCQAPGVSCVSNDEIEAAVTAGTADIVAGTGWLFSRPGMADAVDVLVVDEAGQLSLANVLAVSHAAKSIVLLGDPQQLAQPGKGQHPDGVQASALEHLLGEHATIPPERGVLLDTTWRMHSDIASFVSRRFYDGRVRVEPGCDRQSVRSASLLGGTGLRLIPVEHRANVSASAEEADVVRELCRQVLADGQWTDRNGAVRPLSGADILVLAPFNAQVHRLRGRLAELDAAIRVGTVDKIQGQEAPIVLYSTATSAPEDAPRGLDFLYSLNRFNVAVSRARAVMGVVCSPRLLSPLVHTPEQLRMVNALCAFAEAAGQPQRVHHAEPTFGEAGR